jgi:hypothetical protein
MFSFQIEAVIAEHASVKSLLRRRRPAQCVLFAVEASSTFPALLPSAASTPSPTSSGGPVRRRL